MLETSNITRYIYLLSVKVYVSYNMKMICIMFDTIACSILQSYD